SRDRLRYLPGRLPVEPQGAGHSARGISGAGIPGAGKWKRENGKWKNEDGKWRALAALAGIGVAGFADAAGFQRNVSRQRCKTCQMARPRTQCLRGTGQFAARARFHCVSARYAAAEPPRRWRRRADRRARPLGACAARAARPVRWPFVLISCNLASANGPGGIMAAHLYPWSVIFGPHFSFPQNPIATEQIMLRWLHFIFGIIWIGLLYFFNLVGFPTMKQLEASVRAKLYPVLMSRAMN